MVFVLVVALPPYAYPFPSLLALWQRIWVTLHYLPYDAIFLVLTISTLTSFKRHTGDASGLSLDLGLLLGKLLWSLSFKMVQKGLMSPVEK